ncbi:UNVERIFIED_CONTAM: hypothetical protein Slati_1770000 [Sesamum latifolium]|uniref:Reverse transcriptase Ty1/copia-type domain-containing protein n=1 Tax=Sesamum latifolium TaxID=2727402 RepID=A0AAW2WYK2_9LAMI
MQMDIKNVFLYGDLNETVYMEQPPGYVAHKETQRMVCKLKKAIYGLNKILEHGWINSVVLLVSLVFHGAKQIVRTKGSGMVILAVYVDDIVVVMLMVVLAVVMLLRQDIPTEALRH